MIISALTTLSVFRTANTLCSEKGGKREHNNQCEFISHALWVISYIFLSIALNLEIHCRENYREPEKMGGARKRIDSPNCVQLKNEKNLWHVPKKGGSTNYTESLQGRNQDVNRYFAKN